MQNYGDMPRMNAANDLANIIRHISNPMNEIPVLQQPSKEDNIKIFVGRHRAMDQKFIAEDLKKLNGTPGCAIRVNGKHVYIFGGNFLHFNEDKGLMNGVYTFLQNNTDLIWPGPRTPQAVFGLNPDGNFDIVWGDCPRGVST